jgi:hypothetical protein
MSQKLKIDALSRRYPGEGVSKLLSEGYIVWEVAGLGKVEFRLDVEEMTREAFAELESLKEHLP